MTIGKVGEFRMADDWRLYVERMENYFLVNDIKKELKVPTLITLMGAESYELLVNLCTPDKPGTKTFEYITAIMEKHLQPKPSVLSERYKFHQRKQKECESVAEYMATLKKMTKSCEFGTWLEESIRDQFVCGISSEVIRQRLFAEEKLDYTKAFSMAMSMEAAERNAAVVDGNMKVTDKASTVSDCLAVETSTQNGGRGGGAEQPGAGARGERRPWTRNGQRRTGWRKPRHGEEAATTTAPGERARKDQQCNACGGRHDTSWCKFSRYVCRVCNKQGHLRRVCPLEVGHHHLEGVQASANISDGELSDEVRVAEFNNLSLTQCPPIFLTLKVHNRELRMECDTGSAISCINYETYKQLFSDLKINTCNIVLRYYTGEIVKPIGVIKPEVAYNSKCRKLDLYVIKGGKTILMGRQRMTELKVLLSSLKGEVVSVNNVQCKKFNMTEFSSRYCKVFEEGLGRFTGGTVSIHVKDSARPVFMRARPLAYALRMPVESALEQLVRDGILTPVHRSDWATPIVPVVKKNGTIRICADYKLTLNKVLEVDRYPLPRVEDLLARLHGGEHFSKIDLSQAYAQFELDESKKYTVINTHKGMFMFNRLVYGLASSPAIFQRTLEQLFGDLPSVGVFLDDIIITGATSEEHINNLCKVFDRLQANGLKVNKEKCSFFAKRISYLGHIISKEGVQTCTDKVMAIINTPAPSNVSELRAFLGMTMYYAKFLKNVSTILAPLYKLLRAEVPFKWGSGCEEAFKQIKQQLASGEVLMHYTPDLPLVLTADASSVGVGAVISHITAAGERPIAYASRSLSAAERAYSQIDREALAIVFGIRKFHQYLYGRKFALKTDHKPLTHIFGNKVGIPVMAASRLQRWAILLSGYNYEIEYVSSKKNCADALSRLPQGKQPSESTEITYLNFVEDFLPVTNHEIRNQMATDTLLSRIILYVQSGWPSLCMDEQVKPYYLRRNELYIDCGCLMWGYRIIIPRSLRKTVLVQLHTSHMGIVKTKSVARSYVWWPNIDSDIEQLCRSCETCAIEGAAPPRAQPQPWPHMVQPWTRLHVDFMGPYRGSTFMILIDSTTKWLEVNEMTRTNATQVIKVLRTIFARFGLPVELVSDQGPPFTSKEFSDFLRNNGIRQRFSPAYHPSSNGAAENAVKLCKTAIKKAYRDNKDIDAAVQTFLLSYRNTAQSTTGETPAMLLQRRSLRTRLDLLRTDRVIQDRVQAAQQRQTVNSGGVTRELAEQDTVWTRNHARGDKWLKGVIEARAGTREYIVDNGDGQLTRKHVDHIKRRSRLSNFACSDGTTLDNVLPNPALAVEDAMSTSGGAVDVGTSQSKDLSDKAKITSEASGTSSVERSEHPSPLSLPPQMDRPRRNRRPVVKFTYDD